MKEQKAKTTSKSKKPDPQIWLAPSQWGVWRKCALSVSPMPTDLKVESDDYAKDGTDLHEDIAFILKNGESLSEDRTYEDEAIVRFAVETTFNIFSSCSVEKPVMHVEHFMKAKFGNVTIGGTADCLIDCGIIDGEGVIYSIDHKTGWKEVEAEGNEQIKIYAHLKAIKEKKFTEWKGAIINARFNSTYYTFGNIEPGYLKSVAKDVSDRYAKKQHKTGYHCAYCPRLTTCKHIRKAILDWMTPGAIDGLTRNPEKLSEALRLVKPAKKLFETVQKEAQLYIDLGGIIPGVSIEYGPGNRVFPSDMSIGQIATVLKMSSEQLADIKTVSPTEALRRGADKDAVNAIVIRPPRKGFKFN